MKRNNTQRLVVKAMLVLPMASCLLLGLSGCPSKDKGATEEVSAAADAPTVIANVGDTKVTSRDFEAYLRFKRVVIRSPEQLDEELAKFVQREALAQAVEGADLLEKELTAAELAEFRREVLQARYFERFLKTAVTREAVEDYYKEHASDYETQRVRVAHILVRSKRQSTDEQRAAAKKKIDEAQAQLEGGADFADVAKSLSDDQVSGQRGGDMGWIRKGAIEERFSDAAFALSKGSYSDPIETNFGYHIVKVIDGPEVRKKPLSAVEGDIRHKLRAESKAAEVTRLQGLVDTEVSRGDWTPEKLPISSGGVRPRPGVVETKAPRTALAKPKSPQSGDAPAATEAMKAAEKNPEKAAEKVDEKG